jgi:hypothetical protein
VCIHGDLLCLSRSLEINLHPKTKHHSRIPVPSCRTDNLQVWCEVEPGSDLNVVVDFTTRLVVEPQSGAQDTGETIADFQIIVTDAKEDTY